MSADVEYFRTFPDPVTYFHQRRTAGDPVVDQATDRETDRDYETGTLLSKERATTRVRINALTIEQVRAGVRCPVTFDTLGGRGRRRKPTVTVEDESRYAPLERYDPGDDRDDPGVKEPQAVEDGRVGDLVTDGHGFAVRKVTTNPDALEYCRYCADRLLPPDETSPCEFPTDTHAVPLMAGHRPTRYGVPVLVRGDDGWYRRPDDVDPRPRSFDIRPSGRCDCSGCMTRRQGRRERGGQPVQCGKPACVKAAKDERNARTRRRNIRRDQLLAVEVIRYEPHRTNEDIAADIGIRPIRVREARREVESSNV